MDNFLDKMVEETMSYTPALGRNPFERLQQKEREQSALANSGLVYRVDRATNTFSIRGVVAEKIQNEIDEENELTLYFETPRLEVAEMIHDQMFNRTFPINEEKFRNLGDPSFSWWLNIEDHGFDIFFANPPSDGQEYMKKIGPISDALLAQRRFEQMIDVLRETKQFKVLEINQKRLSVTPKQTGSGLYELLLKVFNEGEFSESLKETFSQEALFLYLEELSWMRKFWDLIEDSLYQAPWDRD